MFPFDIKKSLQWDGIFSISQDSFNRSDVLFKQKSAAFCSVCWFTIPGFNFSDVVLMYTENDVFFAWQWRFIPKSNTLLNRHAIPQYTLHVSKHDNVGNGTVNMFSFKQRNIVTEKVTIEFGSVKKGRYRKRIILNQLSLVISNPFRPI